MKNKDFSNIFRTRVKEPQRNLEQTIEYINNKKKWNLSDCRRELNGLYQFQLDDYKNNKHDNDTKIEFYIKYVKHQESILKGFESHLLTLIATIFLPLSFIVGFFGMNFKSMGAPSLSTGIFNIKHAQFHIFWVSIVIIGVIVWFFYFYLKLL
tara:strand:- start:263 stop:721 length:459 start_codon:yes stop_codon:yes gene_type:complete